MQKLNERRFRGYRVEKTIAIDGEDAYFLKILADKRGMQPVAFMRFLMMEALRNHRINFETLNAGAPEPNEPLQE